MASGVCVQYEHGAVGCVAAWNGSAWHLAEQPAKGATLRGAVGYGELRALVRGEATFTPGPTLLAAARLGATDGIAWLHDESRWELLAVDGVAAPAPPAPGEPAADGPPRWPAARPEERRGRTRTSAAAASPARRRHGAAAAGGRPPTPTPGGRRPGVVARRRRASCRTRLWWRWCRRSSCSTRLATPACGGSAGGGARRRARRRSC